MIERDRLVIQHSNTGYYSLRPDTLTYIKASDSFLPSVLFHNIVISTVQFFPTLSLPTSPWLLKHRNYGVRIVSLSRQLQRPWKLCFVRGRQHYQAQRQQIQMYTVW